MGRRGVGDQPDLRPGDGGQPGDLAGVVHPHLDHRGLVVRAEAEERQRHAHLVVEVPLGLQDRAAGGQDGGHHLAGGGLAVGAGHRHHRQVEAAAVVARHRAERGQGVGHQQARQAAGRGGGVGDHRGGRAGPGGGGQEGVGVEALAAQRHEEGAGRRGAGVGGHPGQRGRRRLQPAAAGGRGELVGGEGRPAHAPTPRARRASSRSSKWRRSAPVVWVVSCPLPASRTASPSWAQATASSMAARRSGSTR